MSTEAWSSKESLSKKLCTLLNVEVDLEGSQEKISSVTGKVLVLGVALVNIVGGS